MKHKIAMLLTLLTLLFVGLANPAQIKAASAITGLTVLPYAGPQDHCKPNTYIIGFDFIIDGVPGGDGTFTVTVIYKGSLGTTSDAPYAYDDSKLGETLWNGGMYNDPTLWATEGDTNATATVIVVGTGYSQTIHINCVTGELTMGEAAAACTFTDGRVNCNDAGQTAAIYCEAGGVTIYQVYKGVGYFAFTVTQTEIAAVPVTVLQNTLIKQEKGIALYRLVGGKLQINGPDGYVYIWNHC